MYVNRKYFLAMDKNRIKMVFTKLRKGKPMTKSDYAILVIFGIVMVIAGMNIDHMMVIQ